MCIKSRKLGAAIKKATGVPIRIAFLVAREAIREGVYDLDEVVEIRPYLQKVPFSCGVECCGYASYEIVGPKGTYVL
jgi:hypothetical protein